jgi:uncharacterized membrane protein YjgN (DUF898 family)
MTAAEMSAVPTPSIPVVVPASSPAARFTGDGRAYWRILLRGAALLAVTLGIYRFWLATDVRRFLWSNTEIAGESLEYTGTPYELLIGFLIALALLVPLYVTLSLVALSAGPIGAAAGALSFPVLFFLGQFAVFRARRYRLTRTIYRGVRCHQDGSALHYAICASFWWIMVVLTVGLAYPFMQSRLERFKMRHTYFGDLQGRFEGSGFQLLLRGSTMWLLVVGPLAGTIAFALVTVDWDTVGAVAVKSTSLEEFNSQLDSAASDFYLAVGVAVFGGSFSIIMVAVLYPVFQAVLLRWWLDGLRLGGLSIHSGLRTGSIYGAYLRFLGFGLLFAIAVIVLGSIVAFLLTALLVDQGKKDFADVANAAAGIGFYVIAMLGFSAIYQATVKLGFWRSSVETMSFSGLDALDSVHASGAASSAVGEGLADALNVGGI